MVRILVDAERVGRIPTMAMTMQRACQWIQSVQTLFLFAISAGLRWLPFGLWIHSGPSLALCIPAQRRVDARNAGSFSTMTNVISPEAFQVLVDRTGLKLTPTQFDELRGAYPKLMALAARLKGPRDVSAEPAATFSAKV
jgi:hypothetical protein